MKGVKIKLLVVHSLKGETSDFIAAATEGSVQKYKITREIVRAFFEENIIAEQKST
jgi:hypothetical protein